MSKEKITSVYVDENGNIYELKKSVWKRPLFWTTIVFGIIILFLMILVHVIDSENVNINNALAKHNVYYSAKDKEIYNISNDQNSQGADSSGDVILTKKFGEKITFDEGTIEVRNMDVADGQVTVAIIIENNADRKSSFNPKEFVAKAGDEVLNYAGLQEFLGLTSEGEVKIVSPKSNAVFFLNYNLPKNNSSTYSMKIGKYLWK